MSVTIAVRFPLGRYHATPWDRSVNEGAVEWPPSPWRILRALVATWYTRWPDLPAPVLDALLEALGDPPAYRTPPVQSGHTRHYLPDSEHRKGETGATDLTLDPYLSVPAGKDLLIRWDADLTGEQRAALAKLVELMPYLGRADSVCEARLLDSQPQVDDGWWRPDSSDHGETVRLLAPCRPVRRPILEMSTVDVRKARRTVPPETRWVAYAEPQSAKTPTPNRPAVTTAVDAVRFFVQPKAPFKATHGVLLADEVHRQVARKVRSGADNFFGRAGAATDHQHAHWLPLPESSRRGAKVAALIVWVPRGLSTDELAAIISVRSVSGRRGPSGDGGYEVKGFPPADLLLQAAGRLRDVAPELYGPARTWRSVTPYLPVRHRKREPLDAYLSSDIERELRYRHHGPATVTRLDPDDNRSDRWALDFRRYRRDETLAQARPGFGLRLEFDKAVTGPLLLGQLSHFGYGVFIPDQR